MFKFKRLEVNTEVHIFMPNHKGETTKGTIVHVFDLPDNYSNPYYVIAIPILTLDDDYVVRTRPGIRLQPLNAYAPEVLYDYDTDTGEDDTLTEEEAEYYIDPNSVPIKIL